MELNTNNSFKNSKKGIPLTKCLTECDVGEDLIVLKVNAGQMAKKRLANLGIVPGVNVIKKKAAPFRGPIEINVKGSSLVIGRGLAAKIVVKCSGSSNL